MYCNQFHLSRDFRKKVMEGKNNISPKRQHHNNSIQSMSVGQVLKTNMVI